jgi:hypothetical protein
MHQVVVAGATAAGGELTENERHVVTDDYPNKEQGFLGRLFGWGCGIIVLLIFVLGLILLVGLVIFGYKLLTIH